MIVKPGGRVRLQVPCSVIVWAMTKSDLVFQGACWYTGKTKKTCGSAALNQLRMAAQKVAHEAACAVSNPETNTAHKCNAS